MKLVERLIALFRRGPGRPELNPGDPPSVPPPRGWGGFSIKDVDWRIPHDLQRLLNQADYTLILSHTIKLLGYKRNKFRLDRGILSYARKREPGEVQLNFNNLVKHILGEEKEQWPAKIAHYIDRLTLDRATLEPLLESFDAAREHLTIRVHTQHMYESFPTGTEGYVLKAAIPELYAALAIDLPEQFHVLQKKEMESWDIDEDELFWTAYANLSDKREKIKVVQREMDGFSMVTLFDRDYSAAFSVDFANNCAEWIGTLGSMVSFPARGSVFIHPIKNPADFNKAFGKLAELTNQFFQEDPGPLTNNIYWFHHNRFELFPKALEGNSLTYSIPNRLLAYLRTPLAHPAFASDLKDAQLSGNWEGYYEYGKGYQPPLLGSRKSFEMTLRAKSGQLEGTCIDEEFSLQAGIWGFVDRELISFIKKYPALPAYDIHYTGFYDAGEVSFTGTWIIDNGDGNVASGSWSMVKL
jgi:hypothetical protein